ncbi:S8 family serine peptidase [Chloroflexota bacterium]
MQRYKNNIYLNWDDEWGESANDLNMYLIDMYDEVVQLSEKVQDGNDDPYEFLTYTAEYTGSYAIFITASGNPDVHFNLYVRGADYFDYPDELEYVDEDNSFVVPADSPYAIATGAVSHSTPDTIEIYSSLGPTTDERTKPDLVAPTNVTTSLGIFGGTSAATPHVAGAAVLVKDAYPSYTPTQIQTYLESNAADLGSTGKDNVFGSGRLLLPLFGSVLYESATYGVQVRKFQYDDPYCIFTERGYLTIWDCTDPAAPELKDRQPVISNVTVDAMILDPANELIYLAGSNRYFYVYDYSDPTDLTLRDNVSMGCQTGSFACDIAKQGNYVYVAGNRVGSAYNTIQIVNVTDPDDIQHGI